MDFDSCQDTFALCQIFTNKIRGIKVLPDDTPTRNLANEFVNEQGSSATFKWQIGGYKHGYFGHKSQQVLSSPHFFN